jgi:hypothetical protein
MWSWAVRGDVSSTNTTHAAALGAPVILCRRGNCKQQEREEYSKEVFHFNLLIILLEAI